MRNAILVAVLAVTGFSSAALAEGKKIGVSWAQFQEERWKIDEAAMKAAIEAAGNEYISERKSERCISSRPMIEPREKSRFAIVGNRRQFA